MPKGFELVAEQYDKNVVVKKLIMVSMTNDTPDNRGRLSIVKEHNFDGQKNRISNPHPQSPIKVKTEDIQQQFTPTNSFLSPLNTASTTSFEDALTYQHNEPLPAESHLNQQNSLGHHDGILSPLMFIDLADIRVPDGVNNTEPQSSQPSNDEKDDHETEMLLDEELSNTASIDGEIYTKRFENLSMPSNGNTFSNSAVQPYASPHDKSSPLSAFLLDAPLINFSKYVPNVTLSPENSKLYYHFLNDFMPSISPSHPPPKLTVCAQWSGIVDNPFLLEIFLSCGASYMSFKNPNFSSMAENRYRRALRMLSEVLEKGQDEDENTETSGQLTQSYGSKSSLSDQDWVFPAILTLLLRDRAIGASGSQLAKHLIFLNTLLMKRLHKKSAEKDFTITPLEKTIFDSSLFNYTNVIMCCSEQDLVQLPDPSSFYGTINKFVSVNMYNDSDFKWVLNPVTGSAIEEFQIMGKLIWLLRLHHCISNKSLPNYIKNEDFWNMVMPLKEQIELAKTKLKKLIGEWENTPGGDKSLRVNLSVSNIILSGCIILLEKIINPSLPAYLDLFQDRVKGVFHDLLNYVTSDLHSSCLIHLSLFIVGCASVGDEQRAFLRNYLLQDSKTLNSVATTNILQVLQDSWDRENFEKNLNLHDENYQSFDLLFDRSAIELLCF